MLHDVRAYTSRCSSIITDSFLKIIKWSALNTKTLIDVVKSYHFINVPYCFFLNVYVGRGGGGGCNCL